MSIITNPETNQRQREAEIMSEWKWKVEGDLLWLFAGDNVINFRQVRRFHFHRNGQAGNTITVFYVDGSKEHFPPNESDVIWSALLKAAKNDKVRSD